MKIHELYWIVCREWEVGRSPKYYAVECETNLAVMETCYVL